MKKILCLFSNFFSQEKNNEMLCILKNYNVQKAFPFDIDLFQPDTPVEALKRYDYFILCNPPQEILKNIQNAEFMLSLNMGVEDILSYLKNPSTIKLGRMVHTSAIQRIYQYVLYCLLDYFLLMDRYRTNQMATTWERKKPFERKNQCIGIMGLGEIGKFIAENLYKSGYKIIGYSNTQKNFPFDTYDNKNLITFLSKTNLLINALPLTKETYGILNQMTLNTLPNDSALVNIGRGAHIVEQDLFQMLDTQKLAKAYLDVFTHEPLPKNHPFWKHSKIFITPHISGVFDPLDVLETALEECFVFYQKGTIQHPVNLEKGY